MRQASFNKGLTVCLVNNSVAWKVCDVIKPRDTLVGCRYMIVKLLKTELNPNQSIILYSEFYMRISYSIKGFSGSKQVNTSSYKGV